LNAAGSPTDPEVKWTHLKANNIQAEYEKKWAVKLSRQTIKRLMNKLGYKKRRPIKALVPIFR
jgi:hypothetical protein